MPYVTAGVCHDGRNGEPHRSDNLHEQLHDPAVGELQSCHNRIEPNHPGARQHVQCDDESKEVVPEVRRIRNTSAPHQRAERLAVA